MPSARAQAAVPIPPEAAKARDTDPAVKHSSAATGETAYKAVRSLSRGLAVLRALNRNNGNAHITELAQRLGLHRTTVRRLLETLQDEGLVRRSASNDSYALTIGVRELSEGFRDEEWIASVSGPILAKLLKEVLWPTDLCTLDGDAMIVRETTHRFSRLSFHRSMVGRRLPLLQTAVGLTWLAYCAPSERRQLLAMLARRPEPEYALARQPEQLQQVLEQVRSRQYGENFMSWPSEEKMAAIAVPLHAGKQLMGCLNVVYLARAMSIKEAAQRFLPALQCAAKEIERDVLALHTGQLRRY